MIKDQKKIHSIIVGTFNNDIGRTCLTHLKDVFVDRPIYIKGNTLEETAYRQGQADIVKQILKEVNTKGKAT